MKVKISYIESEKTEEAELYVKQGHQSLEQLVDIIERETYKDKVVSITDKSEKVLVAFIWDSKKVKL